MNRIIGFALAGMMTLLSSSAFARGFDRRGDFREIKMGHVAHFDGLDRGSFREARLHREQRLHGPVLTFRQRQRIERDRFRTERRLGGARR